MMQTFMTRKSFHRSMRDLDDRRLINQFEESLHIHRVLAGLETAYANHPATKMWRGYEHALNVYIHSTLAERVNRFGYRYNKARPGAVDPWVRMEEVASAMGGYAPYEHPPWWEDLWVYMSHRSNLIRKVPDYYGDKWKSVPPMMPYLWPITDDSYEDGYYLYISGPDKKRLADGDRVLPESFLDTREVVYKS